MHERELNLVDVLVEILLRWRTIIAAMLIGMLLMGCLSYAQSYLTFKTQEARVESAKQQIELEMQQAQDSANAEETLIQDNIEALKNVSKEWIEERLTDTQRYNVNYVVTVEKLYHDKVAFVEDSVVMKIDPNSVKRAEITFLVSSNDWEKTYNLVKVYEDLVRSGELFEYIAKVVNISASGLNEIVALEEESYDVQEGVNTVRVAISHSDEGVCTKIAQTIIVYLKEKCAELTDKLGNHELSVLAQSMVTVSDVNIMSQQRSYFTDIVALESSIASFKGQFTEIEWQYYDFLLNGQLTELSISKVGKSASGSTTNVKMEEEGESLTDIINKGVTVHPGVSMTYVILGAILAAFVYVFVVFVLYILNGKVRITDNLQAIYMIPQLGVITKSEKSTRFLGFVDDWIISLRDWNKRKFTREEAINLAAVAVKMAAGKDDLTVVYLVGCDLKEQALAVCDQMKAVLGNDDITVEVLSNILYDAQAMRKLQTAQGAVLVETAGSTLYTEITQELELLKRQDIKVLGGIVVE